MTVLKSISAIKIDSTVDDLLSRKGNSSEQPALPKKRSRKNAAKCAALKSVLEDLKETTGEVIDGRPSTSQQ